MKWKQTSLIVLFLLLTAALLTACSSSATTGPTNNQQTEENDTAAANEESFAALPGKLQVNPTAGPVLSTAEIQATGLKPNTTARIVWRTVEGSYELKDIDKFIKAAFKEKEVELATAQSDAQGDLTATIQIPEDFGGDHDIVIYQDNQPMAKANFFVKTTFTIDSNSGPIGSWITIRGQGIGWRDYGSIWHIIYDNKYTGMITAISTNGTAEAKFRAAGPVGLHTITVESAAAGMPYINREQSPHAYIQTHRFLYTVTEEKPGPLTYVNKVPEQAANGGVQLPEPQNAPGVEITLDKEMGTVNEQITLTAKGLPKNQEVSIVWNSFVGSRVSDAEITETTNVLGTALTDEEGALQFTFSVPDDLGGPPHRIDLVAGNEIVGQTYFKIIPSIVSISPASGPVGTEITIEVKGVGWTEYDNIYHVVYDNAYVGYVCGFHSRGTVTFKLQASGEPGIHLIDLYPGIYKGEQTFPELYRRPQLTFEKDHPGSRIPSIHFAFEVTE